MKRSVDNGVSIIRIFDALNDTRNMECAMRAAKDAGAHVQGAFVYTISPYHKDEDFLKVAQELVQMGADSICIKDMAGLLSPYNAEKLVRTLKTQLTVPIDIHTHFTSGMGDMTYLKAIESRRRYDRYCPVAFCPKHWPAFYRGYCGYLAGPTPRYRYRAAQAA